MFVEEKRGGGSWYHLLKNHFPVPLCFAQRHLRLSTLPVELVTTSVPSWLLPGIPVFTLWPCKPWEEVLGEDGEQDTEASPDAPSVYSRPLLLP